MQQYYDILDSLYSANTDGWALAKCDRYWLLVYVDTDPGEYYGSWIFYGGSRHGDHEDVFESYELDYAYLFEGCREAEDFLSDLEPEYRSKWRLLCLGDYARWDRMKIMQWEGKLPKYQHSQAAIEAKILATN